MSVDRERWERDRQHEEHLQKVAKQSLCAFPVDGGVLCQKPLSVAWIGGQHHLRCGNGHIDPPVDREKSYTELWLNGEPIPIEIAEKVRKKWRKEMEETGLTKAQVDLLEEARRAGAGVVATWPQEKALAMMQLMWPDAPLEAQFKAALLCRIYGLNPVLKQVALIPFRNRTTGITTWEPVLTIEATRVIARRDGPYSYVDGPRIMTKDEQERENGEVDDTKWWGITIIQDMQGNRAPGVGSWAKKDVPYGEEKGNTPQNMAKKRSECQALKRLRPAEMPTEVEVIDAEFIELPSRVAPSPKQNTLPPRAEPRPAGIPPNLVMKTPMDLFGASKRYFNLSQQQVLADLGLTTVQELADVGEAWATIVALHTGPPEGA